VEKDNKPYVELTGYSAKIEPLILRPIYLARSKKEQFLIEPSINSCRVAPCPTQISFTLKRSDEIDSLIAGKFSAMVAARAEAFEMMRRKPLKVLREGGRTTT
jgi:actin related protein 2/3 complex, subunit 4